MNICCHRRPCRRSRRKSHVPSVGSCLSVWTHLRSNAVYQTIPQPPQPSQPQASPVSQTQEDATCQSTVGPLPPCTTSVPLHNPATVDLFPAVDLPKEASEWEEADSFFRVHLVPRVCMEETVDAMNHVLCTGIYDFFAKRNNNKIPPDGHRHQHPSKARQHHQHPSKERRHQRMLKAVKEEKKQTKKQLRALRRDGNNSEAVRTLASTFHHLVKRYSKLVQEEKRAQRRRSRQSERRACHRDFWKYAKSVLDDDSHTGIAPSFSRETAEDFFKSTYSATPKSFDQPDWMPDAPPPTVPFPKGEIMSEEVQRVIRRCKASSTPSPVDQVQYRVLKNCPSLMPALLRLFNTCWTTSSVPSQWKVGVLHLLGKVSAKSDPSVPSNFRPIALTSCMGKVYTSVLKGRWMSFMTANGYLNTTVQKAFVDGISGCTEHHVKLLSIIEEAWRKHKV